jgi:conjugative transposon TraM protein
MSINFKQPKYVLPLIALPFLCLCFYVYHSGGAKKKVIAKQVAGINTSVGDVSPEVKKQDLTDKLDAYRNRYKETDGNNSVTAIPTEKTADPSIASNKAKLDSINQLMNRRFRSRPIAVSSQDQQMAEALNRLDERQRTVQDKGSAPPGKDPMALFRQQMAYMDSVRKASDPAYIAQQQKQEAQAKADAAKSADKTLVVTRATGSSDDFNTVMPEKNRDFIKVVIDEGLTGYAGSRIRLRLLDDMQAGPYLIKKNTYLYALISGFNGQRVTLSVKSIVYEDRILPVKLEVYDLDGLEGLYVPESAFRDFTKDLGGNTVQGVTIDNSGSGSVASQFMMSTVDKMFESTSSAIAGIIRKNKAKIKYNSYLYLIDNQAQQKAQNNN